MRILLFLLLSIPALAQVGQSGFAIQHERYPCEEFLLQFSGVEHPTLAILDGTFGSSRTCLNKFLALPGRKTIEIHIRYVKKNKPEIFDKYLLARRSKKWESYRKKYPRNTWLLSDGLESHDSRGSAKKRIAFIKRFFHGKIVHNPLNPRDPNSVGADFIELHGARFARYPHRNTIFSYDGYGINYNQSSPERNLFRTSLPDVRRDAQKAINQKSILFLWDAPAQGIKPTGNYIEPRNRTFWNTYTFIKRSILREFGKLP